MKSTIKYFLERSRSVAFNKKAEQKRIKLLTNPGNEGNLEKTEEISKRLEFFGLSAHVEVCERVAPIDFVNYKQLAFTGEEVPKLLRFKHRHTFNLDYTLNYEDGWEYHRMLSLVHQEQIVQNRANACLRFKQLKQELAKKYKKAYILGTGPSLGRAGEINWEDGIRIVSNTIVKDRELWSHIQPHIIAAGDAIYHFGISDFAQAFRADLKKRLEESTTTYFVFPEIYFPFVNNEFSDFADRLIPIPMGKERSVFDIVERNFELPCIGNVLNNLLLPLACYFSNNVYMWGFDGRSPNDKLFWKNSDKQFYTDKVPQLRTLHPAFFNHLVPASNPEKYVKEVHGDILEILLSEAENKGKNFFMMHPSYTAVLMKRHKGN